MSQVDEGTGRSIDADEWAGNRSWKIPREDVTDLVDLGPCRHDRSSGYCYDPRDPELFCAGYWVSHTVNGEERYRVGVFRNDSGYSLPVEIADRARAERICAYLNAELEPEIDRSIREWYAPLRNVELGDGSET